MHGAELNPDTANPFRPFEGKLISHLIVTSMHLATLNPAGIKGM